MRDLLSGYYAAVQGIDDGVGRVLEKLNERGIRDNTLIVYIATTASTAVSMASGERQLHKSAESVRHSVKVPCIFNFPGRIKAGAVSDSLLRHMISCRLCLISRIDNRLRRASGPAFCQS